MTSETSAKPEVVEAAPAEAVAPASSSLDARGLLQQLQAVSPTFRDFKPVALRIDKAVAERFPEVDRKVIRTAMRLHTASTRYLKAVEKGTVRFDLDGNPAGELLEEHRAHAAQTLKERFAEAARKKREQAKQDEAARRAAEAERRKTEKLQQLLGKFSRS
jgi:ProP effector